MWSRSWIGLPRSGEIPVTFAVTMDPSSWPRLPWTGVAYIDPGSLWQNAYVESFTSPACDERFARVIFHSIMEARVLSDDRRRAYNHFRPHSALEWLLPAQYATQWSPAT